METLELMKGLKKEMRDSYDAVSVRRNPVLGELPGLQTEQLEYVLGQYTILPKQIVPFLLSARESARASGWHDVAEELTRNVGEELGTETKGVPHYDMLIRGIAEGIESGVRKKVRSLDSPYMRSAIVSGVQDLEATLRSLEPSPVTATFVSSVQDIVGNPTTAYAIGGIYALESSAVPELVIVKKLVDAYFTRKTGAGIPEGQLAEFFRMHLSTWEPGHEEGLRETIQPYLLPAEAPKFASGFMGVMAAMDTWWHGLREEANK